VPRYKLSLCHTPIKPDLLGFPGIGVFACGLRDHVITRFASFGIISLPWFSKELKNDLSKNNYLCGVILILLVRESIFVGWGFSVFNSAGA
jgi:hypothetical protein